MSSLLSCRDLGKAYGAQQLFSGLHLAIGDGDRIGLIGPNGSGKSTLLRIISGLEDLDEGAIDRRTNIIVSYLAQKDCFIEQRGPLDNLLEALAASPLPEEQKLSRAQSLLSRIELDDLEKPVAQLSGGWRKRLSICRSLVVEPDLLVMDEPTNHLDIEGIIWLEQLIDSKSPLSPPTFILVSHDRHFLENTTNRIVELSASYPGGSFQVEGRYSRFLEMKAAFLEQQQRLEEKLANKMRRETQWLQRGPKARTTKARYRIDAAHRLSERLDTIKKQNRAENQVGIDFTASGRKTKKLMEVHELGVSNQDTQLFSGLSFTITPGTRIGMVGRNGCGKSTLLNLLDRCANGECEVQQGRVKAADGLAVASFCQDRRTLDPQMTLRRALAPDGDSIVFRNRSVHVISWAKRFLFRPDQLDTPVGTLSGGEQARILIAELMRQPADILLLDEPTNDLDIASLDVLEEGLLEFNGAVILVTHDRYLLDRVCDAVIGFVGEGGISLFGDYEQWLAALRQQAAKTGSPPRTAAKKKAVKKSAKPGRLGYLDQLEYDQMEKKILDAEQVCETLEKQIEDPALAADPDRLQAAWEELDQARTAVDELYARWDELEQKKMQKS